jgi:hypothetical protein
MESLSPNDPLHKLLVDIGKHGFKVVKASTHGPDDDVTITLRYTGADDAVPVDNIFAAHGYTRAGVGVFSPSGELVSITVKKDPKPGWCSECDGTGTWNGAPGCCVCRLGPGPEWQRHAVSAAFFVAGVSKIVKTPHQKLGKIRITVSLITVNGFEGNVHPQKLVDALKAAGFNAKPDGRTIGDGYANHTLDISLIAINKKFSVNEYVTGGKVSGPIVIDEIAALGLGDAQYKYLEKKILEDMQLPSAVALSGIKSNKGPLSALTIKESLYPPTTVDSMAESLMLASPNWTDPTPLEPGASGPISASQLKCTTASKEAIEEAEAAILAGAGKEAVDAAVDDIVSASKYVLDMVAHGIKKAGDMATLAEVETAHLVVGSEETSNYGGVKLVVLRASEMEITATLIVMDKISVVTTDVFTGRVIRVSMVTNKDGSETFFVSRVNDGGEFSVLASKQFAPSPKMPWDVEAVGGQISTHKPKSDDSIVFASSAGKAMLTLKPDGTISIDEGAMILVQHGSTHVSATKDFAKQFWKSLELMNPLAAENESLKNTLQLVLTQLNAANAAKQADVSRKLHDAILDATETPLQKRFRKVLL